MGKNLYFHLYLFFIHFFIEFFDGVSRGGPYRWSMDRSVKWSMDPVRWTGPRTGGQCFRVTRPVIMTLIVTLARSANVGLDHVDRDKSILKKLNGIIITP